MIGTIISLIVATFIAFQIYVGQVVIQATYGAVLMSLIGSVFLLAVTGGRILTFIPLQRSEEGLTPKVVQLFKRDFKIRWLYGSLIVFSLLSYLIAFQLTLLDQPQITHWLLITWIVLLGIAADMIRYVSGNTIKYFNPSDVVEMLTRRAQTYARKTQEQQMLPWIDAMTEASSKALDRASTSLAIDTIDAVSQTMQCYLETAADREGAASPEERDKIRENVSYSLFYVFDRLEAIYAKALSQQYDVTCTAAVTALGKISVFTAKYELSMASFPIHFLGKFSRKAVEQGLQDVGIKASCTLQEVAKIIVEECQLQEGGFRELFLNIIKYLEELSQLIFRKDKTIRVTVLIQPFCDLKTLFSQKNLQSLPDTEAITTELQRVIEDFQALDHLMTTMPKKESQPAETSPP